MGDGQRCHRPSQEDPCSVPRQALHQRRILLRAAHAGELRRPAAIPVLGSDALRRSGPHIRRGGHLAHGCAGGARQLGRVGPPAPRPHDLARGDALPGIKTARALQGPARTVSLAAVRAASGMGREWSLRRRDSRRGLFHLSAQTWELQMGWDHGKGLEARHLVRLLL